MFESEICNDILESLNIWVSFVFGIDKYHMAEDKMLFSLMIFEQLLYFMVQLVSSCFNILLWQKRNYNYIKRKKCFMNPNGTIIEIKWI